MAEVFLGYTEQDTRRKPVAIKRLLPQLATDKEIVKLFVAEAELLLQFNHPNVVKALELGQVGGTHFIAMEYVHGASLEELADRARQQEHELSLDLLARIGSDVCDVLGYVHRFALADGSQRQVIHRDVSPQNIMLTYAGRVKVLDFGVAKDLDSLSRTRPAALAGKTAYLSPEQVRQLPDLDLRTDIYSLGAVLFELATGRKPFTADTELDTMLAIVKQPSPDPRDLDHRIPDEFAELVMQAMDKDRERRFQTAEQMGAALLAFLDRRRAQVGQRELARTLRELFPPMHAMKRQAAAQEPTDQETSEEEPGEQALSGQPPDRQPPATPPASAALAPESPGQAEHGGASQPTGNGPDPIAPPGQTPAAQPPAAAPGPATGELFASIAQPRSRSQRRWLLVLVAVMGGAALAGVVTWKLSPGSPAPAPKAADRVAPPPAEPKQPPVQAEPEATDQESEVDEGQPPELAGLSEPPRADHPNKPGTRRRRLRPPPRKRPIGPRGVPGRRTGKRNPSVDAPEESDLLPLDDAHPVANPPASQPEDAPGEPDGEEAEGQIAGTADATADPAEPPEAPDPVEVATAPPPKPTYQPPEVIQKRRVAGHDPKYPPLARKAKLRATVMVKIFIEPDGKVGFTKVLKGHPVFEPAVLEAIHSWRFKPYSINGRPVGTYTVYKFVFQID